MLLSERKLVKHFIELISNDHPFALQFHRSAGEAGMFASVHESWKHDKVDAALQRVAAVMIVTAEAAHNGR